MKTTVEIDESKMLRVMVLYSIPTRREVIDRALTEMERQANLKKVAASRWDEAVLRDAMDPAYDLAALRNQETPGHGNPG